MPQNVLLSRSVCRSRTSLDFTFGFYFYFLPKRLSMRTCLFSVRCCIVLKPENGILAKKKEEAALISCDGVI